MYGRDENLHLLIESFHSVQLTGNSEVCVVSGYAGAGKTCLVRDAMEKMVQEGALAAYSKFDQFNQDVPYSAMVTPLPSKTKDRSNVSPILLVNYFSKVPKI
jgi:predicted ATPase